MKNNRKNRKRLKLSLKQQLQKAVNDGVLASYKITALNILNGQPRAAVAVVPVSYAKEILLTAVLKVHEKGLVEMTKEDAIAHDFNNFPERMARLQLAEEKEEDGCGPGCEYPECTCVSNLCQSCY